jgi:hypothetical protein
MNQLTAHKTTEPARPVFLLLWFLMLSFWPRLFILGFWIFGDSLGDAFSTWVIPAAGFLIAPSTTILYAWMYAAGPGGGVSGAEWLVVALGVLFDLWMWGALQRLRSGE